MESRVRILETQLRAERESGFRRVEDMKQEQEKTLTNETSLSKLLQVTGAELDRYRELFGNALMDCKN